MLTQERIDEIKARVAAATPGPWQTRFVYNMFRAVRNAPDLYQNTEPSQDWADADFVAYCADDVPDLLAEVERLRAGVTNAVAAYEIYAACDGGSCKSAAALWALKEPMQALKELMP